MVRHILHHTTDLTCFSDISTVDLQSKQCCVEQYCTDGWLINMCSSSLYKSWCTLPIHYPNHDIMYRTNRQTNKTFLMNICLLVSQLFAGWRMFSFNCDFIKMLCSNLNHTSLLCVNIIWMIKYQLLCYGGFVDSAPTSVIYRTCYLTQLKEHILLEYLFWGEMQLSFFAVYLNLNSISMLHRLSWTTPDKNSV